ncbi:zinc ABC transporter substrate-binding protein AztC [Schaalia sp. 19OD2882]|uniref:zinc ABC transporter substrate-binding protein AztC n=1 Tax=Schaalia sp. 19OD2882 TaxID=2794089 RepID=UPI0020A778B8|nr:zinc ABC transporter substrate-binding protein AztC [Schaalia sp. 19OD2882]
MSLSHRLIGAAAATLTACLTLAGCTGGDAAVGNASKAHSKPSIVVTTNILGDVVEQVVGDLAQVHTLMPRNADPHSFGISAQDALLMQEADLLVTNGMGLEEGLGKHVETAAAAGTPVFTAGDHVEVLEYTSDDAFGPDPHFWTDPTQMVSVVKALSAEITKRIPGIDSTELNSRTQAYTTELTALDQWAATSFATIPAAKRALVTNHHVFGYMARRYDFRIVGAVIPGGATLAAPSAADLEELATAVREAGVSAIFADTSHPDRLIKALAEHSGVQVSVVPLYSESLSEEGGRAATYIDMLRHNTTQITTALGGSVKAA